MAIDRWYELIEENGNANANHDDTINTIHI